MKRKSPHLSRGSCGQLYRGIKMGQITKQEYTRMVVYWLATTLGVEPEDITNPRCRRAEVVDARRAIAKHLLDTTSLTVSDIAELLGHDRYGARMGKGMFKFNGQQEWLKGMVIPILLKDGQVANSQAPLL